MAFPPAEIARLNIYIMTFPHPLRTQVMGSTCMFRMEISTSQFILYGRGWKTAFVSVCVGIDHVCESWGQIHPAVILTSHPSVSVLGELTDLEISFIDGGRREQTLQGVIHHLHMCRLLWGSTLEEAVTSMTELLWLDLIIFVFNLPYKSGFR